MIWGRVARDSVTGKVTVESKSKKVREQSNLLPGKRNILSHKKSGQAMT